MEVRIILIAHNAAYPNSLFELGADSGARCPISPSPARYRKTRYSSTAKSGHPPHTLFDLANVAMGAPRLRLSPRAAALAGAPRPGPAAINFT